MKNNPIFEVSNLFCSYNKANIVVRVESLIVPANSVVFIVGPSGIGKSTLLETLGLMNNTIFDPEQASILFYENSESIDLAKAWTNTEDYLSAFRAKHFSFIFQETNLMPGFTAGQNLCMKMLIQGKSLSDAKKQAISYMDKLDLHEDVFDRMTHELSGGQKQRLAFLRAFLGECQVLFCDEPTGNLDALTADRLMEILHMNIKNQGRSAIIVSHDLSLALKYADMIVPIVPEANAFDQDKKSGSIKMDYVLTRQNEIWSTNINPVIEDVETYLRNTFSMK